MSETTITEAAPVGKQRSPLASTLLPLVVDVAVPLATYYLAHSVFGLSLVSALIVSSVVPAVRTVYGLVQGRAAGGTSRPMAGGGLAGLMLLVNVAGIVTTFLTGDPRLMIAKDGLVSSAIGIGILFSALRGRPLMAVGLRPFLTGGKPAREAAWGRLWVESAEFRRYALRHSVIWGGALMLECVARVVGAYTLPLTTMVWLPTVFLIGAIGLASVVSGPCTERMKKLITEQA